MCCCFSRNRFLPYYFCRKNQGRFARLGEGQQTPETSAQQRAAGVAAAKESDVDFEVKIFRLDLFVTFCVKTKSKNNKISIFAPT
jgi:hypothetical protein